MIRSQLLANIASNADFLAGSSHNHFAWEAIANRKGDQNLMFPIDPTAINAKIVQGHGISSTLQ